MSKRLVIGILSLVIGAFVGVCANKITSEMTMLNTVVEVMEQSAALQDGIAVRDKMLLAQEEEVKLLKASLEESVALAAQLQEEVEAAAEELLRTRAEVTRLQNVIKSLEETIQQLKEATDETTPDPNPGPDNPA